MGTTDAFLMLPTKAIQQYLNSLIGEPVELLNVWNLGEAPKSISEHKGVAYGNHYVIEFKEKEKKRKMILQTIRPTDQFGHDNFSDRAQILIWQHSAFNKLPRHVRSVDVGAFETGGQLKSVGKGTEFFILTDFVEGKLYSSDLDRIKAGLLSEFDELRCLALSDYLVEIHKARLNSPSLYVRRIRDLVGHGECIMGLLDSYPREFAYVNKSYFMDIEKDCVDWRWNLKTKTHRLCQVHGDFHPWNILFRSSADFTVLNRSRGEWGDPADDLAALTINYLFYSLQKHGELNGVFERLFKMFWQNYLHKTGDTEVLEVVAPFYTWRALVVASPILYPSSSVDVRVKLLKFAKNILKDDRFDWLDVNSYFNTI
jgi:hypothetical protein